MLLLKSKGAGLCDYAIFVAGIVHGENDELFHHNRTTKDIRLWDNHRYISRENLNRIIAEPGPIYFDSQGLAPILFT